MDLFLTIYFLSVTIMFYLFNHLYSNIDVLNAYLISQNIELSERSKYKSLKKMNRNVSFMIFMPIYNTWLLLIVCSKTVIRYIKENNKNK